MRNLSEFMHRLNIGHLICIFVCFQIQIYFEFWQQNIREIFEIKSKEKQCVFERTRTTNSIPVLVEVT